jgi:integrase
MTARGTVIRRGNKFSVVLDLGDDEQGKRIRRWHSGYRTKKEAERARTELLGKVDAGEYVRPTNLSVRQFVDDRWLPSIEAQVMGGRLKPNTAASYRAQVNSYILPRLGHVVLKDVTSDMLSRFYDELLATGRRHVGADGHTGLSSTSVRLVHVTVHRILKDAVRWGILPRNVSDAASEDAPRRRKTGRDTMQVWSPEQLRQFLDATSDHRLSAMWVLFITTGLRRGEVAGLRWSEIDLATGHLAVNRARVVVNHKVIDSTPKSERSARLIGLDGTTVSALKAHKARQSAERLVWGPGYESSDLVFTWEDGRPLHPNIISRTFQRLAASAGLPAIRLHDIRHSYASAALEAGVGLKVMQERLGHSSVAITGDIYSHVSRQVDQDDGARRNSPESLTEIPQLSPRCHVV